MKQRFRDRLLAIFFPERCVFCGAVIPAGDELCPACREEETRERIAPPTCPFCGRRAADCTCQRRQRLYDRCVSAYRYHGAVRGGILRLKRKGKPETARFFAKRLAADIRREYGGVHFDGIIPVPLSRSVLKTRGYNPALWLAQELSAQLLIPVTDGLVKLYETRPQKELCAGERSGNLLGVFDCREGFSPDRRRFLLVDDVVTTGSTLEECAKMLKIYGAVQVLAATAAATCRESAAQGKRRRESHGGNGSGT